MTIYYVVFASFVLPYPIDCMFFLKGTWWHSEARMLPFCF